MWDRVNLVFYNVIPFVIMLAFNSLLIINLKRKFSSQKKSSLRNQSSKKRKSLTMSLIILSFLFLIMTTPGTLMFAYLYDTVLSHLDVSVLYLIDDVSFLNHAILFFISFVSYKKFRNTIIHMVCRPKSAMPSLASSTV